MTALITPPRAGLRARTARRTRQPGGWVLVCGAEQMSRTYATRCEALRWLALLRTWHPAAVVVRA